VTRYKEREPLLEVYGVEQEIRACHKATVAF